MDQSIRELIVNQLTDNAQISDLIANWIAQDEQIAQAMPHLEIAVLSAAIAEFFKAFPNSKSDTIQHMIGVHFDNNNTFTDANVAIGNIVYGHLIQIAHNMPHIPSVEEIALDRFKLLPTSHIPMVSLRLPSLQYNLPGYLASFVGRTSVIDQITHFFTSQPQPQVGVIRGMAGMGKSSLVRNIAYRYGHYFLGGIFWISCSQGPEDILNQLVQCAKVIGLETEGLSPDLILQHLHNEWQKAAPKLIIFDDCQKPSDLDGFLPNGGGSYVLITSKYQTRGWKDRCHTLLEMGQFTPPESRDLLQALAPHLTDMESQRIGTVLGDYPFALSLAARYLDAYRIPIDAYLTEIETAFIDHDSLIGEGGFVEELPQGQRSSIIAMFELCYTQLKNRTKRTTNVAAALQRLRYCAANTPLPVELLIGQPKRPQGIDVVSDIVNSGLLEGSSNTSVRMHALVGAYLTAKEVDAAANKIAQDAVESLLLTWAITANDNEDIVTFSTFAPHFFVAATRALTRTDECAGAICFEANRYLALMNQYENAVKYAQHAVALIEHVPDLDIWTSTKWLNGLGLAFLNFEKSQEAQQILEQAQAAIRDLSITDQHHAIVYLSILNNLGILYDQVFENYPQASEYHSQALTLCQQYLPPDHVHIARSYSNLGAVLFMMDQWDAAFENYQHALSIYSQHYQPPHLRLAYMYFNLGEAEEQRSHRSHSIAYFRQAAVMFTQLYNDNENRYTVAAQENINRQNQ